MNEITSTSSDSGVVWVCAVICTAACLADGPSFAVDLALGISTAAALGA